MMENYFNASFTQDQSVSINVMQTKKVMCYQCFVSLEANNNFSEFADIYVTNGNKENQPKLQNIGEMIKANFF